ncbi:MAG: alpha-N-arabinofuranosidase [Armatimonadetes bacterium]|nr:alpha-N-arabinofuranosidase [Armatimonadota bacterium]
MSQATVEILLPEAVGTINPNLYGHFAEHLGSCIYEGIWVGEDAAIPNTGGIRDDVAEALRRISPPVIRWPGGCFADDYHWQDGIGPRSARPGAVNIHWGNVIESNAFGTHEFITFCRRVGAAPYICGNVGSGSPREMRDWVEYCNYPGGSTLSDRRAENGSPEPFGVRYWGVGNENWGCGGHFSPEDYGTEFKRFATYLRDYGTPLHLIACGPPGNDVAWTRRFFEKIRVEHPFHPPMHGYSAHYYCGTAGASTEYTEDQWYQLLYQAADLEPLIVQQRAVMDVFDPRRAIGLIVDEWGTWHPTEPGRNPAFLWQQNTMRDALVAALSLDIFNRHADKVVMGNIAQTINVLQSMILTDGPRMVTTPTYHVYDLYQAHQGGQSVRTLISAPSIGFHIGTERRELFGLTGSASLKGNTLTATLVNLHTAEPVESTLRLWGDAKCASAACTVLAHEDIHAHNTFEAPETVTSVARPVDLSGSVLSYICPPASVTRLDLRLGG